MLTRRSEIHKNKAPNCPVVLEILENEIIKTGLSDAKPSPVVKRKSAKPSPSRLTVESPSDQSPDKSSVSPVARYQPIKKRKLYTSTTHSPPISVQSDAPLDSHKPSTDSTLSAIPVGALLLKRPQQSRLRIQGLRAGFKILADGRYAIAIEYNHGNASVGTR
jgi:hypothetical protein